MLGDHISIQNIAQKGHTCPALGNKGLVTGGCGAATVAAGVAALGIMPDVVETGACGMWFIPGR